MKTFLQQAKSKVSSSSSLYFVMGNESCDMDSVVSSICYAFEKHLTLAEQGVSAIPIINVAAEDLPLRTEVTWLFQRLGVPLSSLLCWDEINLPSLLTKGSVKIGLVDHNRLCPRQDFLSPYVVDVLDHHVDEGVFLQATLGLRKIKTVGSCATLVTQNCTKPLPKDFAMALMMTILIDTANFDPELKKTTPDDETAVRELMPNAGVETVEERDSLYQECHRAKFDVKGLTIAQSLCKDYKAFTPGRAAVTYGVSSILELYEGFVLKPSADPSIDEPLRLFAHRNQLDVLMLMFGAEDPITNVYTRQLWLSGYGDRGTVVSAALLDFLLKEVKTKDGTDIGFQVMATKREVDGGILLSQRNIAVSRKVLTPLIDAFIAKL